jgi:hypothetical protein
MGLLFPPARSIPGRRCPTQRPERFKIFFRYGCLHQDAPGTTFKKWDEDLFSAGPDTCQHRALEGYESLPKNCTIRGDFKILPAMAFNVRIRFSRRYIFKNDPAAEVPGTAICHAQILSCIHKKSMTKNENNRYIRRNNNGLEEIRTPDLRHVNDYKPHS